MKIVLNILLLTGFAVLHFPGMSYAQSVLAEPEGSQTNTTERTAPANVDQKRRDTQPEYGNDGNLDGCPYDQEAANEPQIG